MNMIEALRLAAKLIGSGSVTYNWRELEECNCGIVAQIITGKTPGDVRVGLDNAALGDGLTWTSMFSASCPITGIPQNEILLAMHKVGFSHQQIHELEYLSNTEVQRRAGILPRRRLFRTERVRHSDPQTVALYMNVWANMLEADQAIRTRMLNRAETARLAQLALEDQAAAKTETENASLE